MKAAIVLSVAVLAAAAAAPFSPARLRAGAAPAVPVTTTAGGEVALQVTVDRDGRVTQVATLRTTPPFTGLVADAVSGWSFAPAEEELPSTTTGAPPVRTAVNATVLVAGSFRPPSINAPTIGQPPRTVGAGSDDAPVPLASPMPPYPPNALADGVVLVEAHVDAQGNVDTASVVRSAPPFDDVALTTARAWRFRPARHAGAAVDAYVYLLFGFRAPVVSGAGVDD